MGRDRPIPGTKMNIGRMSKRTLESWAHYYGVRHLADGVPLTRKPMVYQRMLIDIQREGRGPIHGHKMTRLPMSQSDWPNKTFLMTEEERAQRMEERRKKKRERKKLNVRY
ncbi:hypothetical protein EXIGLDRAFT_839582 [Exidia glandulosa HHB12029]|uniref:Uncharacterized protein n=1 Tax=Exidia glandulosa HHB12029 TaxID=1314781 RepID=A0A165EYV6_EXIGL|nr:hypothetical protein EXIGLDRAFT_839582 [Exidia glandulosa HHB12029]